MGSEFWLSGVPVGDSWLSSIFRCPMSSDDCRSSGVAVKQGFCWFRVVRSRIAGCPLLVFVGATIAQFFILGHNSASQHLSPETIKKLSLYRAVFSTFFEKR